MNSKNKWFGFVFLLVVLASGWVMKSFREETPGSQPFRVLNGYAQGTTYHIKYYDEQGRDFRQETDSVFRAFDLAFSAWEPESEINKLNRNESSTFSSPWFYPVLEKSREVYESTGGAFDPTVAPLVKAWGFGPEGIQKIPSDTEKDSLMQLVGFSGITFDREKIQKRHPNMQLDFNAVAPGYTTDVLASLFQAKGIRNFFIEIGGEVYAGGVNEQGKPWRIGINTPSEKEEEQMDIQLILQVKDRAVTTSGNYRRFYEKEGVKYAHTISPFTGKPVSHSLLSATVVASDCITADAYATAFMVLGPEKTLEIVEKHKDLAVILIYSNPKGEMETYVSPQLSGFLIKNGISRR